jgi:hypothetical protein
MKKPISFSNFSEADTHKTQDGKTAKKGLWYNINQRKKKGLSPKKPGSDGYPKTLDIEGTEGYVSNAQRAAVWANRADGGKGHPDNKKKSKKEEVNLDEISTDMQKRYMKKAVPQYNKANDKKEVGAFGSATQKGADSNQKKYDKRHKGIGSVIKRKAKGDDYISTKTDRAIASDPKRNSMTGKPAPYKEGAMKRMSTGDGMDTYKKKPDEVKSINKGLMKNRNNPQEKDKDVKKINKSLSQMRTELKKSTLGSYVKKATDELEKGKVKNVNKIGNRAVGIDTATDKMRGEAFSSRAIVKKDRQGSGKPMAGGSDAHKAAVKKYVSGMKSNRPGNTLPRQMKDPKKDAMVSKGGKVKVIDKSKEDDHLKKGYVRAEHMISKELYMREAKTMTVTHPKTPNKAIEITVDQWPSFKMRGYHHAEQKENMNTMRLINKMKKASPAAKKALEAPSRVKSPNVTYDKDGKVVKKVNEVSPALLKRYIKKSDKQAVKSFDKAIDHEDDKDSTKHDKIYSHGLKRGAGATKARDKLVAKGQKAPNYPTGDRHRVNELTIADVRKGTEKAKKRQEKERKATGKTSTSTTDLAARNEGKAYGPTGVSYSDEPNLVSKPKPKKPIKLKDRQVKLKNFRLPNNEDAFKPHMMYDPKTGKGYKANKEADHLRMKKMGYTHDDPGTNENTVDEALDMKQRLARGRSARKNKSKLAMGRKKAGRRIASMKVLKKRARRAARKTLTKRLTKGVAKSDLSVSRKREIEKRLDKPAFKIKANRLVKRTIKDIRKKEIARKRK